MSLSHLGYEITQVDTGETALELLGKGLYDLLILDMLMPGMSGEEVFLNLKEIRPEQKVLIMTGYSAEDAVKRLLRKGALGLLNKPFTIDELAIKVRECLDK
ncbi:UNVERIFIED_CONTAM: hypothetical protein GTU68_015744 [Idotea baltica]|nr:hypothetical protein [Idotea baltica]